MPKNEDLKKRWIANIKRVNLPKTPMICHLHFDESCFKRDLEVRWLLTVLIFYKYFLCLRGYREAISTSSLAIC